MNSDFSTVFPNKSNNYLNSNTATQSKMFGMNNYKFPQYRDFTFGMKKNPPTNIDIRVP